MEMDFTKYSVEELRELQNKIGNYIHNLNDGFVYICEIRSYGRNWKVELTNELAVNDLCIEYDGYDGIVIERNIPLTSMCSHHHQTIGGVVHIGYIVGENGSVIGLSKLNRMVEHFGRRGAIQEQLTSAIHQAVDKICENNRGVIVTIVATHNCVSCRGVKHQGASMVTTKASGVFMENDNLARKEFFDSLKINNGHVSI